MAFFIIKLWLIYSNPTAVLDQSRQTRDTLGHPAGGGRVRDPRPDTWFRRDQIDTVNQRMQHGRDNGIGDPAIWAIATAP